MDTFEKDLKKLDKFFKENNQEEFETQVQAMTERYTEPEQQDRLFAYVKGNYQQMKEEVNDLQDAVVLCQQLEPYKEIVPLKYIAKEYFGKSAAWLSQRINGCSVRGKVYTLKPAEIDVFNDALHDIGMKLGSISLR